MQDSENNTIHETEEDFTLDLLFSYSDMAELPKQFFSLLPNYCDNIINNLDRAIQILESPEGEGDDPVVGDLELSCIAASNTTHLATHALYRSEADPVERLPDYGSCDGIVPNEFFFI